MLLRLMDLMILYLPMSSVMCLSIWAFFHCQRSGFVSFYRMWTLFFLHMETPSEQSCPEIWTFYSVSIMKQWTKVCEHFLFTWTWDWPLHMITPYIVHKLYVNIFSSREVSLINESSPIHMDNSKYVKISLCEHEIDLNMSLSREY